MSRYTMPISDHYEYLSGTAGADPVVDLEGTSVDFSFVVGPTVGGAGTDSLDLVLNGGDAIRMYEGERIGPTSYPIENFQVTAVSGTPAWRATIFEYTKMVLGAFP